MATGDGSGRPPRRSRPAEGERGAAPVAYLPGAWRAAGSLTPERDDGSPANSDDATEKVWPGGRVSALDSPGTDGPVASTGGAGPDRRGRRAENVSMSALARRGMSRYELEKTLLARDLDAEVVESELTRLESVGLVDDAALAQTLVRTQHERKGLGRGALIAELRRRHIDQEHIDAALEQVDDTDEAARAGELAERRARQLTSLDRDTAERRLTGYLMRKGYSSTVVRAAVDAALPARRSGGVRFR